MTKLLSAIRLHKRDYSKYLLHFTKSKVNFDKFAITRGFDSTQVKRIDSNNLKSIKLIRTTALDNLKSIIENRLLKGNKKFLLENCVCFTETPIYEITKLMNLPEWDNSRYQAYGIAFKKEKILELGGRPVIYQDFESKKLLNDSHKFLHNTFDLNRDIDFSWEREWRVKGDVSFSYEDVIFIVPTADIAFSLMKDFSDIKVMSLDILLESL